MYTGHVGIALAARGIRRDVPLWVLVVAAQACDWVEVLFSVVGTRFESELWSHAFPFVLIPAAAMAALVWLWKRSLGAAVVVLAAYLSHPFADLFTSVKPLWLGGPPLGFGFVHDPVADFIGQTVVCIVGWSIYARSLPMSRARRLLAATPLIALLALQGLGDLAMLGRSAFRRRSTPVASHSHRTGCCVQGEHVDLDESFAAEQPSELAVAATVRRPVR